MTFTVLIILLGTSFILIEGLSFNSKNRVRNVGNCPRFCPAINDPVCGSDGIIYGSHCELQKRTCGTNVISTTWDVCTQIRGSNCTAHCLNEDDPVCGSDGRSYSNMCHLMKASCKDNVHFSHYGGCYNYTVDEECPTSCNVTEQDATPVCSSDGNVYRSSCQMKFLTCGDNVVETSFRHCQTTKYCTAHCRKGKTPICGSDGHVYTSDCHMKSLNCGRHIFQVPMVFCLGQENNKYRCPTSCENEKTELVCGSDTRVYDNECELRKQTCGNKVDVMPMEVCSKAARCSEIQCPGVVDRVCGSDSKTYSNLCHLEVAKCRRGVTLSHMGACRDVGASDVCPDRCTPGSNGEGLICGSDGNVYRSACELKQRTCGQKVVPVEKKYCRMTAYCDRPCNGNNKPVCGSDGNLYKSDCHMHSKNCGKYIYKVPMRNCLRGRMIGCLDICPLEYKPVCGSDRKTYSNNCFLDIETCVSKGRVKKAYSGKCGDPMIEYDESIATSGEDNTSS